MDHILYLPHRLPYPPDKGDKIRSYHTLRALAQRFRVHLGTFIDDPRDTAFLPQVQTLCASVHAATLVPRLATLRSATGLLTGAPLSVPYYADAGLRDWVRQTVAQHGIRRAVVFSSPMAQYLEGLDDVGAVIDFCDVDSAKWPEYAARKPWPLSWVYRREGRTLLAWERAVARRAVASVFVSAAEADLFRGLAPEAAGRVHAIGNGIDGDAFVTDAARPSPCADGEPPIVFTGAMDYLPNADAVRWFAREVLPAVRAAVPAARLAIVGMNPTADVQALASDPAIVVTGRVDDVRPWLQHAAVVVAPLRVARGVQNKVLEAMAMGRPVVATTAATAGLEPSERAALQVADTPAAFAAAVLARLADRAAGDAAGLAARAAVLATRHWNARLAPLLALVHDAGVRRPAPSQPLHWSERHAN